MRGFFCSLHPDRDPSTPTLDCLCSTLERLRIPVAPKLANNAVVPSSPEKRSRAPAPPLYSQLYSTVNKQRGQPRPLDAVAQLDELAEKTLT